MSDRIALVAALPEELSPLRRRVRDGRLGEHPVALRVIGTGPARAAREVEALLKQESVDRLLLVGVAGGLTPGWQPLDVLVPGQVLNEQGDPAHPPDPSWRAAAASRLGLGDARLVTSPRLVATVDAKRALAQRVGAGPPLAVDMEASAVARVAHAHRIPYLVLRAITDTAADELPRCVRQAEAPDGSVRRLRVLALAARHPTELTSLARLRDRLHRGAHRLADLVPRVSACVEDMI